MALASLVAVFASFHHARFPSPVPRIAEPDKWQQVDARLRRASDEEMRTYGAHGASRAIYRYSVVPGGVLDRRELSDAAKRDPIVAAHYSNVSFDAMRARIVTDRRMRYMSYRLGSRIYWTSQPVALRHGETILDDGATQVRARCGNLISEEPRTPTYVNEPPPTVFDDIDPNPPVNGSQPVSPHGVPAHPSTIPGTSPGIPGVAVPLIIAPPIAGGPSGDAPSIARGPVPFLIVGDPLRPAQPPSPTIPSQPDWNPIIPIPGSDGSPGKNNPGVPGPSEQPHSPVVREDSERPEDPVKVPEPGTWLLMGVGGAVAAVRRRYVANR